MSSTTWHTEVAPRTEYVDYLGHVTAAAHLTLFEEAHWRWLAEITGDSHPAFVLARLELDYRHELLAEDGPVRVTIAPVEVTRSSTTVEEMLVSARGIHTQARAVIVRWDRAARRSMPFLPLERERLLEQLCV